MDNVRKTKKQLIKELAEVHARIAELEAAETEHRQTEETLLEERNILRILINSLPDFIYAKDTESRFIIANAATTQVMGAKTPNELVGKTDFDFYPEELAEKYRADEKALIDSGQPLLEIEEPIIDPDGNQGWISTTKVPLRDDQGQVVGFVGVGRDITARKQAEAERERLQEEIFEAQQRAIQELSTPVIPIMDVPGGAGSIIVMPLIGSIDTMRARDITRALLTGISQHRAKVVIIDITGVPVVDSGVANYLNKTIQAARLKGARTIITGISDAVAETIVDLGIDWSKITTLSNLQMGLMVALKSLGVKLSPNRSDS